MKKIIQKFFVALLAVAFVLQIAIPSSLIVAEAADTVTVSYDVTYCQTEARSMLSKINEFRTGGEAWYWNQDDVTKTECNGLSELHYDYTLEAIAMQRAAEIAIYYSQTRPSGQDCWSAYSEVSGTFSYKGENIAAGATDASAAFTLWQETDEDYSGQGRRRNMLDSSYNAVGIACVYYNGYYYWVQEFGFTNDLNASITTANDSVITVSSDVLSSNVSSNSVTLATNVSSDSITMVVGNTVSVPEVTATMSLSKTWPEGKKITGTVTPTWSVGDSSLLSIASDGTMTALKSGTTTLTAAALGETVSLTVAIKSSITECSISLSSDSYTYDGTEKKPAVTVKNGTVLLVEGTDYSLSYSDNISAGTATVTITGMSEYAGSAEKAFIISKADYSDVNFDEMVLSSVTSNVSVDISGAVQAGGTCGTPTVSGTGSALLDSSSLTVSGSVVSFNTTSQDNGTVAKITIPVTGCTNYNDYDITITVTAGAAELSVNGSITGYTGISIEDTVITLTIGGASAKFASSLTGTWITNLPSDLSQNITRVDDTTVQITVSGTPGAAFSGALAFTIPTGNLTAVSSDLSVTGGSIAIEKASYILTLTDCTGTFDALTYGYSSGNSVAYTFENTGNQDITGIYVDVPEGFSAGLSAATVVKGDSLIVTVSSDTGLHAGTTAGTLELNWTNAENTVSLSLSQTVNKAEQSFSYNEGSMTKHINDADFTNALTRTTGDGTISYTASDTDIATVDEDTGKVTIVGAGTTNITATAAATGDYNEATTSYTLTVTDHRYTSAVTKPTCTTGGYTTHTCTECGDSYKTDYTDILVLDGTDGSVSTKMTVQEMTAVPEGLKYLYASVDALVADLISRVTVNAGYTSDNALVYDVVLQYSTDGGTTWITATVDNFPTTGITVTLPYPDGTDSSYEFTVLHMFTETSSRLNITAGGTETPTITKTENGLVFTLTGLSPVAISWKEGIVTSETKAEENTTEDETADADTSSQTDDSDATTAETTDISVTSASSTASAPTGDDNHMMLWLMLLFIAGFGVFGVAACNIKKRHGR